MPPIRQVNKDFLKAVFKDTKKLLKKNQINYVAVPCYDELAVKNLWPMLKKDAAFVIYFQDDFADQKMPNRDYFFNILNTIYPEYLQSIMRHAAKLRFTLAGEDEKPEAIQATDEWLNQLKDLPFKSRKFIILHYLIIFMNTEKKREDALSFEAGL